MQHKVPHRIQPQDFMSARHEKRPRKRLFIGLVTGTSVLLCLFMLVGWIIPAIGFDNIHPSIPYVTGLLLVLCIGIITWASFSLVLQISTGRSFWGAGVVRGVTIRFFLPVMELLARLFGIKAQDVRRSFIRVNNELVLNDNNVFDPEHILILLPHCLQRDACAIRLSYGVDGCKRCRLCPMAGLLDLRDAYGVGLAVATGGTIARRIVVESRPKLIIAVACERDLTSGIQDTHPLPVFGILNDRPEGPCRNTLVALDLIEKALRRFVLPGRLPEPILLPPATA
ncbi:DUF116 domain-containing protein [Desulfovibrio sp. OttesenSCG-928-M16]|nr:DUF116 domain-containing protein [Desulfovibrio sp. OttesenSCG-928-M16]